jgi:hexosaminidase
MSSIVPAPRSVFESSGRLTFSGIPEFRAETGAEAAAELLRAALEPAWKVARARETRVVVHLAVDDTLAAESYRLSSNSRDVRIVGGDSAGVFYGTQAFRQLLPAASLRRAPADASTPPWSVPIIEIEDAPAHRWRGLMLDTVRHFVPVRDVLRLIDLLALHRMNVLHLHLTDDQGWRVQIRRYPRLTEIGGWRTGSQVGPGDDAGVDGQPHGGFYTRDDIREIVSYAAARHITVVPEIEMPGHARAAIAAHPELGVTGEPVSVWDRWGISDDVFNVEESTIRFLENVLDEVMELFPSEFIGLGGDECPKVQWHDDPRTQALMAERNLADEEQLQAWFVGRLEQHLRRHGRRAFGWDEILEGDAVECFGSGTTVASWRGEIGAVTAARRGFDVVACPADRVYLDYRQSDRDDEPIPWGMPIGWREVYAFEPVPAELTPEEALHVLGGQGNLWTEHLDSAARLDYMLFPRLGALAEALWTGPGRSIADFERRLPDWLERLRALGVDYRPEQGPLPWQQRPTIRGLPSSAEDHAAHLARITENIR